MSKKKKFEPFNFVREQGALQVGTLGVTGLASRMPSSPQSGAIQSSMGTMALVPKMHAVGGVFGSLGNLERIVKKKKR